MGAKLLPDLPQEGLGALAVRRFVIDDLARDSRLRIGRETWGVADLFSEEVACGRAWPGLLFDDRRTVRRLVVRGLRLRDVVEPGVRAPAPTAMTARTSGDLAPGVLEATVTAADAAELRFRGTPAHAGS
jgi:hypothetical protein